MFYRAMKKASTYRTKKQAHFLGAHEGKQRPVNLTEVLETWFLAYIA